MSTPPENQSFRLPTGQNRNHPLRGPGAGLVPANFAFLLVLIPVIVALLPGCRGPNAQCERQTALLRAEILDLEDRLYAIQSQYESGGVSLAGGEIIDDGQFPLETYYAPPIEGGYVEGGFIEGEYTGGEMIDMGDCCSAGDVIYNDGSYVSDVFVDSAPAEYYGGEVYYENGSEYLIPAAPAVDPFGDGVVVPPEVIETPEPKPLDGEQIDPGTEEGGTARTILDRFRGPLRRNSGSDSRPESPAPNRQFNAGNPVGDIFVDEGSTRPRAPENRPRATEYDRSVARPYDGGPAMEAGFAGNRLPATLPSHSRPSPVIPAAAITEIHIAPHESFGVDLNNDGTDEGLVLLVQPRDADGRTISSPGQMTVSLIDPAASTTRQRIGLWEFESTEIDLFEIDNGGDQRGFLFHLPWDRSVPRHKRLMAFVRYVTADGRRLETSGEFYIEPPQEGYSPTSPIVEAWTLQDSRWLNNGNSVPDPAPLHDPLVPDQPQDDSTIIARGTAPGTSGSRRSNPERPRWRPVR